MAKGIEIDIAANTLSFQKGVQDVDKELSKVADSLDDLADETKDSSRTSIKEVSKLEDGFKALADTAKRETKAGGDAMGKNFKDGTTNAKRDLAELGNEAKQNASETFSSFDGSAESFADGIQGTLGGVVSSLGPVGAAAGAAGALGIGLIMAAMGTANEDTEAYRAKVAELGAEFIATGGTGETSLDFIVDKLKELASNTEDGTTNLEDLADAADGSGSSFKDLARAFVGGGEDIEDTLKNAKDRYKDLQDEFDNTDQGDPKAFSALSKKVAAQEKYVDYLKQGADAAAAAAEQELNYANAGGAELEQKAASIGSIQDAVDDAAGSWEDYQNKETGALDPAAYLAGVEARIEAGNDYADNMALAQTKLNPAAYQYLVDQGIDFAPMLSSILDSGLVGQFNATFTEAAAAGNAAVESGVATDVDVTANVDANTTDADSKLEGVGNTKVENTVAVDADTRKADAQIKTSAEVKRTATIAVTADLTGAERAMSNFMNKARTVTVTAKIIDRNGRPVL